MNTTILCSFDGVDLAEIAVGRLRSKIPGLKDIEISKPDYGEAGTGDFPFAAVAGVANMGTSSSGPVALPVYLGAADERDNRRESDIIPKSVMLRLTCNTAQRHSVEAQLINLGALRVRAFDELPPS